MEALSQRSVLQKLLDSLCQETDPGKIYQILKEMSSVPILRDRLAEIGFRKTIKCLKKQQLLVSFVKDLVAKWSTGPEQPEKDFGLEKNLTKREGQSTSPEENPQERTSPEPLGDMSQVFYGLSSCSSGRISCVSPSRKSHTRSDPRATQGRSLDSGDPWSLEEQLGGQKPVQAGTSWASLEEPCEHEGAKPLSRKPGSGPGEHTCLVFGGHRASQPPGHWEQEEAPGAGSLWACLDAEGCSPCSSVRPDRKRKRELPCLEEAQRTPAKLPRSESGSSKDLNPIAACAIPESHSSGQACFPRDVGHESSCSQQDQEASPWGWEMRTNYKTPVYSDCRPAARPQQKSHLELIAEEPAGTWDVDQCQAGMDKAGPGQPEEKSWPKIQTCKQMQSRSESPTPLQLQASQEARLQALRARIQSRRAKRPQARQTRMISFHTQLNSPGQQGEPGPRAATSAQNSHSIPQAPALPGAQRASSLPSGQRGSKKVPAKKPAPLMAKTLRDYGKRFSRR